MSKKLAKKDQPELTPQQLQAMELLRKPVYGQPDATAMDNIAQHTGYVSMVLDEYQRKHTQLADLLMQSQIREQQLQMELTRIRAELLELRQTIKDAI